MNRKARAAQLFKRVSEGPSFGLHTLTQEQRQTLMNEYRLWAQTWIMPELTALIPELRPAAPEKPLTLPVLSLTHVSRSCKRFLAKFPDDRAYLVTTYPDSELMFVENMVTKRTVGKSTLTVRAIRQALEAWNDGTT